MENNEGENMTVEVILDMPYDFYNYIPRNKVFFLAQHYEAYNGTALMKFLKTKHIFLDNGAWPGDGGETMEVKEYIKIADQIHGTVVASDVLGDSKKSMELITDFNYHYTKRTNHIIFPLQGRTISEYLGMYDYLSSLDVEGNNVFAISKGTRDMMLPDRHNALEAIFQHHDADIHGKIARSFHFFGYHFGGLRWDNIVSIDTRFPIKYVLGDNYDRNYYYDLQWKDLTDQQRIQIFHYVRQFDHAMDQNWDIDEL